MSSDGAPSATRAPEGGHGADRRSVSMLITRHFVLLAAPQTGADVVRRACFEHFPIEWLIANDLPRHTPYDRIAVDFADLPMFGLVRNPWDWYVRWYEVMTDRPEGRVGPLWRSAFDDGRSDFRTTVWRACTGEGLDSPLTADLMRRHGIDHFSALCLRTFGDGGERGRVEVGRCEAVGEELPGFLERHGVVLPDRFASDLRAGAAADAGHRDYRSRYDDELEELVAERARHLIAGHGYAF